jgi:hypothetical protein
MTSQEVIKFGQQIIEPLPPNQWTSFYLMVPILIGICLLVILSQFIPKMDALSYSAWITIIALLISFILSLFNNSYREELIKHREKIDQWTEEVAYPYIESLPTMERELDTVILDTQMVKGKTYTNELPLIISYTEKGKTITTSATYEIEKRLKDGEKPVLEYKRLNSELGHDVTKGDYFLKIILPKNFKLEPSSN